MRGPSFLGAEVLNVVYKLVFTKTFKTKLFIFLFLCRTPVFLRFSGLFRRAPFVYTRIIEQKRIAGQVKNIIILILF